MWIVEFFPLLSPELNLETRDWELVSVADKSQQGAAERLKMKKERAAQLGMLVKDSSLSGKFGEGEANLRKHIVSGYGIPVIGC